MHLLFIVIITVLVIVVVVVVVVGGTPEWLKSFVVRCRLIHFTGVVIASPDAVDFMAVVFVFVGNTTATTEQSNGHEDHRHGYQ